MLPKIASVIIKYLKPVSTESQAKAALERKTESQAQERERKKKPDLKVVPLPVEEVAQATTENPDLPAHPRPGPAGLFDGISKFIRTAFASKSYDDGTKKKGTAQSKEGKGSFIDKKVI